MPTPPPSVVEAILIARRARRACRQIAETQGVGVSTVARILKRRGLNRPSALEPLPPVLRCEYPEPGGLLHLDIKKLGPFQRPGHRVTGDRRQGSRGAGWKYVHVAVDDHTQVAFGELYANEKARSAWRFLIQSMRYYRRLGVRVERILTDKGTCYRSRSFRRLCRRLGLRHLRTKPYTPRTNGKAERFIQTALREWAYAHAYVSSDQRAAHLPIWLHLYNWDRPHPSLGYRPPVSLLANSVNNLVGLHN